MEKRAEIQIHDLSQELKTELDKLLERVTVGFHFGSMLCTVTEAHYKSVGTLGNRLAQM